MHTIGNAEVYAGTTGPELGSICGPPYHNEHFFAHRMLNLMHLSSHQMMNLVTRMHQKGRRMHHTLILSVALWWIGVGLHPRNMSCACHVIGQWDVTIAT